MSNPVDMGRRSLLTGKPPGSSPSLLPPWAVDNPEFYELCTRCHECINACPEHILTLASGGFPTANFTLGECSFCGDCTRACPSGALQIDPQDSKPWRQAPVVNEQCLAKQSVVCRSCGDNCEAEAIQFNLADSHPALPSPQIDNNACTGCGACISVCPTQALTMQTDTHPTKALQYEKPS